MLFSFYFIFVSKPTINSCLVLGFWEEIQQQKASRRSDLLVFGFFYFIILLFIIHFFYRCIISFGFLLLVTCSCWCNLHDLGVLDTIYIFVRWWFFLLFGWKFNQIKVNWGNFRSKLIDCKGKLVFSHLGDYRLFGWFQMPFFGCN